MKIAHVLTIYRLTEYPSGGIRTCMGQVLE